MYTLFKDIPNPYDKIPVTFCKHCLSLKIRVVDDTDFCDECGNTNTSEALIDEWEELYQLKYNHKFLNHGRKRS